MCFGDLFGGSGLKKQKKIAKQEQQQANQQEQQRQADITAGQSSINKAFSGFDNNYFNKFKTDYTNYYDPQIDDKYRTANGSLVASLADRGLDESTVGADAAGKLRKTYTDARTQVANDAADAANTLRSNIEQNKTNLYNINATSADPKGIDARARAEATSLVAPQSFTPLGDVFAASLQPLISGINVTQRMSGRPYQSPFAVASGAGSGSVIR